MNISAPRHTARGIVIRDGQLILIERWRQGKHYFSIPGGGIEDGETLEQTAVREILEETGCRVSLERELYLMKLGATEHHIFLCRYESGEVHLPADSPEALHMTDDNRFKPTWLPLDALPETPFLIWEPIRQRLVRDLEHGFSGTLVTITADVIP